MTWSNATYYFQNHSTNWILHSDYFKSLQDDKMHEDISETYFINKNGYLKDSIQTSFNFAHEEHGGSLEHSAVVLTILEVDILLWKTSQSESAIIFALHGAPPFWHETDGNLVTRKRSISTPVFRASRCARPDQQACKRRKWRTGNVPRSKKFESRLERSVLIAINVSYKLCYGGGVREGSEKRGGGGGWRAQKGGGLAGSWAPDNGNYFYVFLKSANLESLDYHSFIDLCTSFPKYRLRSVRGGLYWSKVHSKVGLEDVP